MALLYTRAFTFLIHISWFSLIHGGRRSSYIAFSITTSTITTPTCYCTCTKSRCSLLVFYGLPCFESLFKWKSDVLFPLRATLNFIFYKFTQVRSGERIQLRLLSYTSKRCYVKWFIAYRRDAFRNPYGLLPYPVSTITSSATSSLTIG